MSILHIVLAFALAAPTPEGAFQRDAIKVVSATRNHMNAPGEILQLNMEQGEKVRQILMQGTGEPAVFIAEYSIGIRYRHKRELVLVNGNHFKFHGRTYATRDDLGSLLSSFWRVAPVSMPLPNHDEGATDPSHLGIGDDRHEKLRIVRRGLVAKIGS